jgi:hypothetical protein
MYIHPCMAMHDEDESYHWYVHVYVLEYCNTRVCILQYHACMYCNTPRAQPATHPE